MSESHSAQSGHDFVRRDAAPADPTFEAKLQQAAHQANENCDRATALAHKLSTQLREAQSRINQLERDADGRADRLWAEAKTAVAKLQSEANARVERIKREADERIARVEAEAESRIQHMQSELARAQQLTHRARADAQIAHDGIARVEAEAHERLSRTWAEIEDRFIRLKADLAQAELRADRAEQWLVLIRKEIEDHLMPSFAARHDRTSIAESELSRTAPSASVPRDDVQAASTFASDVATESESDLKSSP